MCLGGGSYRGTCKVGREHSPASLGGNDLSCSHIDNSICDVELTHFAVALISGELCERRNLVFVEGGVTVLSATAALLYVAPSTQLQARLR